MNNHGIYTYPQSRATAPQEINQKSRIDSLAQETGRARL